MEDQLFSPFKEGFYRRVKDLTIFDAADVNLLKVVLDGLKVDYATRFPSRTPIFLPAFVYRLFLFLKRRKYRPARSTAWNVEVLRIADKKAWCVDFGGRNVKDKDGNEHSFFFENIIRALGRGNTALLSDRRGSAADLYFDGVVSEFAMDFPEHEDEVFRSSLKKCYKVIRRTSIFSRKELQNIRIAFQRFFDEYRGWKAMFRKVKPRAVFFTMHYHREGFLLALRKKGIRTIELQHGLIAAKDTFYVFPPQVSSIRDRALFADRIMVFGSYWKELLDKGSEYPGEHSVVAGYFPFENDSPTEELPAGLKNFIEGKKIILVCTQTLMHEEYISWIERLSSAAGQRGQEVCFIIKPHPHEDISVYSRLERSDNVRVVQLPLPLLMRTADIHLSIYSTTHFDALRFGVRSFALPQDNFNGYVNEIIQAGVAQLIPEDLDLLAVSDPKKLNKGFFYADFSDNSRLINSMID
jgi:hypothetical protein